GENETVIELKVAQEDLNHFIGRQGRTVRAMRSLLAACSAKQNSRYTLELLESSTDNTP
ncbi:MAG: KH domain-containing protein, partial [Candidatus Adiutrix sp.]